MNAVLLNGRQDPGKRVSAALALAVHAALIILLVYGIRWQTRSPEAVEVELVRAAPVAVVVPPKVEPAPEIAPPPKVAPEPVPKPDIAIKEKPKPPERKPEPKPEPKLEPKPAPKAEPKPAPDKADRERMAENLKAEQREADRRKAEQEQAMLSRGKAMADYISKIKGKIKGKMTVLPPGLTGNPEAIFTVAQLPSGEILSVKLKQSSGNAALDAAIERAINNASPLPLPEDKSLFERNLELKFRPLED